MSEMTEVCSLRDRGEPEDRDVMCTRPGPYGNPYTVERHGWRALDLYRKLLLEGVRIHASFRQRIEDLAGKRLLCACPTDSLACHVWILAEEVERLTGVPVKPAPGRERT